MLKSAHLVLKYYFCQTDITAKEFSIDNKLENLLVEARRET